ncbi:MAG: tetratricopeptide repeat protein [Isosphaeraceae bacterium]
MFRSGWLGYSAIAAATGMAYANSFSAAQVFDGLKFIDEYAGIRQLWPPSGWLATNRPVVFFTFAVNYAMHGTEVWGYHAVNLAIHVLAACVLLALIRDTLASPRLAARYGTHAGSLALAVAMLWAVHPLQTQSVTYVYQRLESLMGLFFLTALYCFERAGRARRPLAWYAASLGAWLLALGSKEVAATAPLVILWYDRAFLAESWIDIARKRWAYYVSMLVVLFAAASVLVWRWPMYVGGGIGTVKGISWWQYAASQPGVILHYLRLSVWPAGQCIDYGWPVAHGTAEMVVPALTIGVLVACTLWCAVHRPSLGFLGGSFFIILAPTSTVVPICDLAFEHRMYLSLAAVVAILVFGTYELLQQAWLSDRLGSRRPLAGGLALATVAVALTVTTALRNEVYESERTLWSDTVQKAPKNPRGYVNLGHTFEAEGDLSHARALYREALHLAPDMAAVNFNLANILADREPEEAIRLYRVALKCEPEFIDAHDNLATLLARQGDIQEALGHSEIVLRARPEDADAHFNMAQVITPIDRNRAEQQYRAALRLRPDHPYAHYNLAMLLAQQARYAESKEHLRKALSVNPNWPQARAMLVHLERIKDAPGANRGDRAAR